MQVAPGQTTKGLLLKHCCDPFKQVVRWTTRSSGKKLQICEAASPGNASAHDVRRLIMMRHADSERQLLSQDHARPITADGRQEAQQVAQKLQACGWLPQLILCSSAVRTLQTLETMREAVAAFGMAEIHSRGTLFTVAAMDGMTLQHLQEIVGDIVGQAHVACLMCLGHNKGWEEAVSILAGRKVKLGTSYAALLEGRAPSWESAFSEETQWSLVDLLMPEPQSDVQGPGSSPLPQLS